MKDIITNSISSNIQWVLSLFLSSRFSVEEKFHVSCGTGGVKGDEGMVLVRTGPQSF